MKHTRIFSTNNEIQTAIDSGALKKPYVALYGSSPNYNLDINTKTTINDFDYVDLGLSSGTLWATCNVGASSPEDYGGYFAWGEVSEKSIYGWGEYIWWESNHLTKYNATDGKTSLDIEDDAAHIIMGNNWVLPTKSQIEELCTITSNWVSNYNNTGIGGREFTGTNGNKLFIPAAGRKVNENHESVNSLCILWCSEILSTDQQFAYHLAFHNEGYLGVANNVRYYGCSCRGVINPTE